MKETRDAHEKMTTILRENAFDRIDVKRIGSVCYLIITANGETHVYNDSNGMRKEYRHAWQARDWLIKTFGISPNLVHVETIKPRAREG